MIPGSTCARASCLFLMVIAAAWLAYELTEDDSSQSDERTHVAAWICGVSELCLIISIIKDCRNENRAAAHEGGYNLFVRQGERAATELVDADVLDSHP